MDLTKEILERRYGTDGGQVNVLRAAQDACGDHEDPKALDRARGILRDVAYRHAAQELPHRLQQGLVVRLSCILERIEPGARDRLNQTILSRTAQEAIKMAVSTNDEWAALPTGMEMPWIEKALDACHHQQLEDFEAWALEQGHEETRIHLSRRRILAPLACFARTLGVERAWYEFTPKEKVNFLRWGIAREKVLLRRATTIERASRYPASESQVQNDQFDDSLHEELGILPGKQREETRQYHQVSDLWRELLLKSKTEPK